MSRDYDIIAVLLYYHLSIVINYPLVFFSPVFKANFDNLLKKLFLKVFISILLKYIGSNLE